MSDLKKDFIHRVNWELERELIPQLTQMVQANITERLGKTRSVLEKDAARAQQIQGYWQQVHTVLRMGLSAIPVAGGYINWAYQFGSGDPSVIYKLMRAGFDDGQTRLQKDFGLNWWPEGNGVMGPLGPDDTTMDYGNGRVKNFSDDPKLKAQQLECDVIDYVSQQASLNADQPVNLQSIASPTAGSLVYQGMPGLVLMAKLPSENWSYYAIALMVKAIPFKEHNALKDLQSGYLFTDESESRQLLTGNNDSFFDSSKRPWLKSSKDSSIYKGYLKFINYQKLKGVLPKVVSNTTLNRVLAAKAGISVHLGEKVEAIAYAGGESMTHLFVGDKKTQFLSQFDGFQKHGNLYKAMIGRGGVLRNMLFFLPSKVYNKNTTWAGKDRGKVLCGIHAFYSVLQSYIDFPFVANMAFNENNTRLLVQAILDAFWSAYLFMKSKGLEDNEQAKKKDLLLDLIRSDPGIQGYFANGITGGASDYSEQASKIQYGIYDAIFGSSSNRGAIPFTTQPFYEKNYYYATKQHEGQTVNLWAFTPETAQRYPLPFLNNNREHQGLNIEQAEHAVFNAINVVIRNVSESINKTMEEAEVSQLEKLKESASIQEILQYYGKNLASPQAEVIHGLEPLDPEVKAASDLCTHALENVLHGKASPDLDTLKFMFATWRMLQHLCRR